MQRLWAMALLFTTVLFTAVAGAAPALAQGGDSQAMAQSMTLFTRYPTQEMAIGENVTIDLTLRTGSGPEIVQLEVQNLPAEWTATFRGGGRVIGAAYVDPENDTKVDLRLDPPADVAAGTYRFTIVARGETGRASLPIELIVKDKLPPSMTFDVDLPTLRGSPSTTFRYNATLKNEGDQDLTVNLVADAPPGFQVNFSLSGQDVTSIPLTANESKRLSVEVKAFDPLRVPAGQYQVNVLAQGEAAQATTTLIAEVTGQAELTVTTPDGRLSGQATVGDTTPLKLLVQNTGTAPARNVELSASSPNGWTVEFDPKQIAELAAGNQVEVTANLEPSNQAVAGDYVVTVRARPEDGSAKSADFRITVRTSTLWGVVGVALIAVAVAVVGLAVMRFGRR